ncbi:MAG: ribulose phosphate epimerase [Phycisphaerae bacterium SM23_30]|nr:MAG: ribulose phosphate epimerase [Phycisphaerae bacterium SM23_30]
MFEDLKNAVCQANMELHRQKLTICSWGNVSGIDREAQVIVIKPSGIAYEELTPAKMVACDMNCKVVEGKLKPSSDTPIHLELYRSFASIGGVCHTHSPQATTWAQACREIPCLGTTHADYFYGAVPVTEPLSSEEIEGDFEINTGKSIVRRFCTLDPQQMPAVLVANHGPFTWGPTAAEAVEAAVVLEQVALIATGTLAINPQQKVISQVLLDKHYLRKHGKNAYYGQK